MFELNIRWLKTIWYRENRKAPGMRSNERLNHFVLSISMNRSLFFKYRINNMGRTDSRMLNISK